MSYLFKHFEFLTFALLFADEDNVLKLSDHIKNNPFAKINDDDSLFGSSSKSILRQSRLQFTSVLKPSPVQSNTSTVSANSDNLFSSSLTANPLNRNAIPCKIEMLNI